MTDNFDIIVIGAGPAGLLAAGSASSLGVKVVVLEKMEKPARKLRITGKGRCNITNVKFQSDYFENISPNPTFLDHAFKSFFYNDIIDLLAKQGVDTIIERGQRVFPKSGKAWDVAEGLIKWAKSMGALLHNHSQVEEILRKDNQVVGVKVRDTKTGQIYTLNSKSVIISTGGQSYPLTGSTGDGYMFAKSTGHRVTKLFPSLIGIETKPVFYRAVGLILKNIQVTLFISGQIEQQEFGELEITDFGLDGPIILKISRKATEAVIDKKKVEISIDLKPALTSQKLYNRLVREIEENGGRDFMFLLKKLVPSQLTSIIVKLAGISPQKKISTLTVHERNKLVQVLKGIFFEITGYRGWDEAIVTAGGVATNEVDPASMESRKIKGLYLAGEVLDLDGNTGGYNLQIAFSTGWLAGKSAATAILLDKEIEH